MCVCVRHALHDACETMAPTHHTAHTQHRVRDLDLANEKLFQMRLRTYASERIIVTAQQPQPHIASYKHTYIVEILV